EVLFVWQPGRRVLAYPAATLHTVAIAVLRERRQASLMIDLELLKAEAGLGPVDRAAATAGEQERAHGQHHASGRPHRHLGLGEEFSRSSAAQTHDGPRHDLRRGPPWVMRAPLPVCSAQP